MADRPTKIVIFGASGPTGRALVEQALSRGHGVTGFVRDPARLPLEHERLTLVCGDVLNQEGVDAAVAGQDAVFGALGIRRGTPKTLVTDGTRRIIAAMERHEIRRYVGLSAYGAGETRDGSLYTRMTWLMLRPNLEDKQRHEALLRGSDLDWTLVRPPRLTDGEATGRYETGTDLRMKLTSKVTRADVAAFMLDQLDNTAYTRRAPSIVSFG